MKKFYVIIVSIILFTSCIKKIQDDFFTPIIPNITSIGINKTIFDTSENITTSIGISWSGNLEDNTSPLINVNYYLSKDTIIDKLDQNQSERYKISKKNIFETFEFPYTFNKNSLTGNIYLIIETISNGNVVKKTFNIEVVKPILPIILSNLSLSKDTFSLKQDLKIKFKVSSTSNTPYNLSLQYYLSKDSIYLNGSNDIKIYKTSSFKVNNDIKDIEYNDEITYDMFPSYFVGNDYKYLLIIPTYNDGTTYSDTKNLPIIIKPIFLKNIKKVADLLQVKNIDKSSLYGGEYAHYSLNYKNICHYSNNQKFKIYFSENNNIEASNIPTSTYSSRGTYVDSIANITVLTPEVLETKKMNVFIVSFLNEQYSSDTTYLDTIQTQTTFYTHPKNINISSKIVSEKTISKLYNGIILEQNITILDPTQHNSLRIEYYLSKDSILTSKDYPFTNESLTLSTTNTNRKVTINPSLDYDTQSDGSYLITKYIIDNVPNTVQYNVSEPIIIKNSWPEFSNYQLLNNSNKYSAGDTILFSSNVMCNVMPNITNFNNTYGLSINNTMRSSYNYFLNQNLVTYNFGTSSYNTKIVVPKNIPSGTYYLTHIYNFGNIIWYYGKYEILPFQIIIK